MAQLTQRETPAPARAALAGLLAAVVASVLLGLLSGLIWHVVAPLPVLQQVGAGTAEVVNPETRAFIGADGWFCTISAVAGLLTGIIGYRMGIARRGSATRTAVAIGLILGAVAGGYTMLWLGQEISEATGTRTVRQRSISGEHTPVRQYVFPSRSPRRIIAQGLTRYSYDCTATDSAEYTDQTEAGYRTGLAVAQRCHQISKQQRTA